MLYSFRPKLGAKSVKLMSPLCPEQRLLAVIDRICVEPVKVVHSLSYIIVHPLRL